MTANDAISSEPTRIRLFQEDENFMDAVSTQQGLRSAEYLRDAINTGLRVELARRMFERGTSPDTVIATIDGEPLTVRQLAQSLLAMTSSLLELQIMCGVAPAIVRQAMDIVNRGSFLAAAPQDATLDQVDHERESLPVEEIQVSSVAKKRLKKMGVRRVNWDESEGS